MLLLHESREDNSDHTIDSSPNPSTALYSNSTCSSLGGMKNKFTRTNKNNTRRAPKGGGNSHSFADSSSFSAGYTEGNHSPQVSQYGYNTQQHQHASSQYPRPYGAHFAGLTPGPGVLGAPPPTATIPYGIVYPQPSTVAPWVPSNNHQVFPPLVVQSQMVTHLNGQTQPPSFGGHATYSASLHGYQPQFTDLASVFSSISIQPPPPDQNYYMNSGASSHMTFNPGS